MEPLRVVEWDGSGPAVVLLDQRALPGRVEHLRARTVTELGEAVRELAVRGAPCLGLAGVYGVALAAHRHGDDLDTVRRESQWLAGVRPTAVPLRLGV
ncbi:MAG: S-methyl-5-thioribose-1-phosphate isomerase, partial [Actinomycetota bacterium]|nr:S-methyl-5-thioribose-1-phosphate isomerase [Actinomycetota bacterium]